MNIISGKVLHQTKNIGLQELIVLLYDIDYFLSNNDPSHVDPGNTANPFLDALLPTNEGHPMIQFARRVIYSIYTARDENEDPVWRLVSPAGGRLGSALTGEGGNFSIRFDDPAFQGNDQEQRPDALLLVLAPDQSLDITLGESTTSFIGTPEYQRILHMSFFPLRNIAREEAVVIKIDETQLERFNLGENIASGSSPEHINAFLNAADTFQSGLIHVLRDRARNNVATQQDRQANAEKFALNLSALPKAMRRSGYFLHRRELDSDRLRNIQTRAVRDGIDQVALQTLNSPVRVPQAYLSITEEWLTRLLPNGNPTEILETLSTGSSIELEVDYAAFCAMLYAKNRGANLTRNEDALRQRAERDEVLERIQALRTPTPEPDPDDNPPNDDTDTTPSGLSAEDQIKTLVLEQVMQLSSANIGGGATEEESTADQRKRISISLRELTPPVSPADATAYHDYTTLQIAFPNIWTEAFDGNVEELVRDLRITYEEAFEAYREGDGDILDRLSDFSEEEIYDLKEYTQLLGQLTGDISSFEKSPIPELVKKLWTTQVASGGLRAYVQVDFNIEERWNQLSMGQQAELIEMAEEFNRLLGSINSPPVNSMHAAKQFLRDQFSRDQEAEKIGELTKLLKEVSSENTQDSRAETLARLEELRSRALSIAQNPGGKSTRAQRLMTELAERLKAPHSFQIFAENSYNFGILTTHRQKWVPGEYQTGDLVSTITLAPGEKRQYVKKENLKRTRNRKETEKNASTLNDERVYSNKATEDIASKASTNTNFAQSISGSASGQLGIFSINAQSSTDFSRDQAVESERAKQSIREATRKAAQEYSNERSLEISTEGISSQESSFTSEISNPNNEITVTYLFYELERQYKVTEHLHKVSPVILIAQHVPAPHEIDEDWILTHDWILRRVILDRSFLSALDFISEGLISDEVSVEVLRENYETQKVLVEDLSTTVSSLNQLQESLRNTLIQTSAREKLAETYAKRAKKSRRRRIARRIFDPINVSRRIAGGNSNLTFGEFEKPEVLEARREALETRLEFLESNLEDAKSQLNQANSALNEASEELTAALKESFTKRNLVTQLKLHLKENILYYMQAIWTHEYAHQRYMRLYNLPIDIPMPGRRPSGDDPLNSSLTLTPLPAHVREGIYNAINRFGDLSNLVGATIEWPSARGRAQYHTVPKRLHEIADVDKLLGFKGNYMIFPLKTCTFITDYMMQDYVDEYLGVRSPDPLADLSTDELLRYAEQIWHHEDTTTTQQDALEQLILERLNSPRTNDERIVVPTGQLFIEALKGNHALLEHFKLKHREMDVQKVQEEVRSAQLENLRKALRLVREEGALLDDPDVDKHIQIDGETDLEIDA